MGGCTEGFPGIRDGAEVLDRLPVPDGGWHIVERRSEWAGVPPRPASEQRAELGGGDGHG